MEAAKKGNRMLGMMKRTIVSREKEIIIKLYKSLVRPHLEYCVQAWNPFLKKDIELLENVQRRVTKMVSGCHSLSYEKRLEYCGLTTLERRREGGFDRSIQNNDREGRCAIRSVFCTGTL
jgi:hypothetical protein